MTAILALVMANLPALIAGGKEVFNLVSVIRAEARRTGEWTADQESAFQAELDAQKIDPAWQADDSRAA